MKQFRDLVQTNQKFQKSVNLQLDLGDYDRIDSYIPTRSSAMILERYFSALAGKTSENASILIGPYGKGKSHLLLVLLALLSGNQKENEVLYKKLEKTGQKLFHMHRVVSAGKKYLPVLIHPSAGNDLNQIFTMALGEALSREQMEDIAPDSYYSEAVKTIESWRIDYPDTYSCFKKRLEMQGQTTEMFETALLKQQESSLAFFKNVYPKLTAGSIFAPLLRIDALLVYRQALRILTGEKGYAGIFIVFDEFSKYIEGHEETGFSADMKVLQDMCELANGSGQSLYLTLVAHKSIHEYGKGIKTAAKNSFRGVEGRLDEIEFVVSAQNNYELISDAIIKCEPDFSMAYQELLQESAYHTLIEESYQLPCFRKLFTQGEYKEIIARGCFPLVPLFPYALLHISEKTAQNERTIFTFLADKNQGSLDWLLQRGADELIGIDKIYDYFKGLFRENTDQPQIHHEWLKAEYALAKTDDTAEKAVIKAIAVIRMIHREEELPTRDASIRLGLAFSRKTYENAVNRLKDREIIVYRSSIGVYAFRNNVGVNVEKAIGRKIAETRKKADICRTLREVMDIEYELPRQYNQKYSITRYFQYTYMLTEAFLQLQTAQGLFEETFSDGKIIILISRDTVEQERLQSHLDSLNDERVILLVSEKIFEAETLMERYEAVRGLKQDEKFIEGNQVLLQELALYEEDIAFEINAVVEKNYLPENKNVWILQVKKPPERGSGTVAFGSILSEICEDYYRFSPKVNHELLNIQYVGNQYLRARNMVVKRLLEKADCQEYLTGTSPEAMVYRAAFVHSVQDIGCARVYTEIDQFFELCAGEKHSFRSLYERLFGRDYGVRRGIIPLFLAKRLSVLEAAAVIYVGNRELETDYETLNKVNDHPESYELYLEAETAEKELYLRRLEEIFCKEHSPAVLKQRRLAVITGGMQSWYRSLPQYTTVTRTFEPDQAEKVTILRNALKRAEINPRELLFERLPQVFGNGKYGNISCAEEISLCKKQMDQKLALLKKDTAGTVKQIFLESADASMKACLKSWYGKQGAGTKNYILSTKISSFLSYLEWLETNDELEITEQLSKIILDVYIEDWNDETPVLFSEELRGIKQQVEDVWAQDRKEEESGRNRIILRDARGKELKKYYDAGTVDSTGLYLKNVIEEAMEEFGDTLEMNQKVAVLVEMLEELIQ